MGSTGDSNMTMNDFLGNTQSLNIGIEYVSGSLWWGNNLKSNQPELWPGMGAIYESKNRKSDPKFSYEQTWSGISVGGAIGAPQIKAGASLGHGVTKYLEWANKKFNTVPHSKKYQYRK